MHLSALEYSTCFGAEVRSSESLQYKGAQALIHQSGKYSAK